MVFQQIENQTDILKITHLRIQYLTEVHPSTSKEIIDILFKNNYAYLLQHIQKDCFAVAAFQGDKIVSSAFAGIYQKSPNCRTVDGIYAEIYGVYTLPEFRKRHLATQALQMLLNILKINNIHYVQLDASEEGLHIYERLGFKMQTEKYKQMWLKQ